MTEPMDSNFESWMLKFFPEVKLSQQLYDMADAMIKGQLVTIHKKSGGNTLKHYFNIFARWRHQHLGEPLKRIEVPFTLPNGYDTRSSIMEVHGKVVLFQDGLPSRELDPKTNKFNKMRYFQ